VCVTEVPDNSIKKQQWTDGINICMLHREA